MEIFDPRPLQSSMAELAISSMGIPLEEEFSKFDYNNFTEFTSPIEKTDEESRRMLIRIGTLASDLWGIEMAAFGEGFINDDMYLDWLVNVNNVILQRVDRELFMKQQQENAQCEAAVATKMMKAKIPFHIPTIPKPQDEYRIIVNNSNQPFEHIWLPRTEDGSSLVHPLEKFSVLQFVEKSIVEPLEPPAIDCTPFTLVEDVKDLKALAAKLRNVDEFAVDLEHNQYRSFQGLTCLMQISTRTEDFIVDTLKLRIFIGPYLREIFKDPKKRKIMHGADRDIMWLQRDFGIYVCNLFDTGQASRVLKMERNSLEHLLKHFCGVTANKEYQAADWRLRPLPVEMLRYAREDTHYLLYIYDLMRMRLLSSVAESEHSDTPLVEVYKRSYDTCMQLYVKELLTDTSYLNIYGLQDAGLNAQQLAVVAGLCEWRDVVARAEDESTGYILPNKTLIQIGKEMPLTTSQLRQLVKSKHPYIERNLDSIISVIRHSMQNADSFEAAVEHLKVRRAEIESGKDLVNIDRSEVLPPESPQILMGPVEPGNIDTSTSRRLASMQQGDLSPDPGYSVAGGGRYPQEGYSESPGGNAYVKNETDGYVALLCQSRKPPYMNKAERQIGKLTRLIQLEQNC